mmetsp:Transcript_21465/g.40042  ORF Transcript_21465/g.40042 Transcript_21465/m.40042 type:complete len:574 (+) Transcript_21465:75-1796(+)
MISFGIRHSSRAVVELGKRSYGGSVLSFRDVSFEYKQMQPILEGASFSVDEGSKVTIMGQNGSGKSTILKLIQGELVPDSGQINNQNGLRVAASHQVMRKSDSLLSVKDYFKKAAPHLGRGIEGDIHKVLQAVQLEETSALERAVNTYSGGQQARLLLAAALIQKPDLLLLDEPTNNLDMAGIDNLTDLILDMEQTCLVISHDETFLNSFTDSVLYLDAWTKQVESYDGNYLDVKRDIARRIQKENQQNARLAKEAEAKKAQAGKFANKGGGLRKVAQKMRKVAAEMKDAQVSVRKEDRALRDFSLPAQFGAMEVLNVNAISLPSNQGGGIATIPLELPVVMNRGMRMHLYGPNGIGKTTLLQHIVENKLDGCTIAGGIRVGYYRQDFSTLNFEHTVVESLREVALSSTSEQDIRKTASNFLLSGNIMHQKIGTLSEGQKGLCAFARLVLQEPGLLILDEPTNHINFRHLPAIQKALNEYQGTMIMVSHDHAFVKKVKTDVKLDLGEEMVRFKSILAQQKQDQLVKKKKSPIDFVKLQEQATREAAEIVSMLMKAFSMNRVGGVIKKYSKMKI